MAIIEVKDVSKKYPARRGTKLLLGRGGLADIFSKEKGADFMALEGVCLEVNAGESLGIIGRNGSGKSTLLKILAGVTLPSSGTVRIEGRVASLLELGAGFHPMLTGRENIYLNAGLMGMRAKQVTEVFDQIVEFSGIADFIDQPVDTYSSGMYVRIAFSVAVHANPDIFLVDEVLAVGDEEFQRKCRVKIGELKQLGKTIVFVSHDLGIVHSLCDRVVLLHKGAMIKRDTPQQTIDYYLRQIGRESGIHTMNTAELDLIFNHGRLTLYKNKEELSGPTGINVSIMSMGQEHLSNYADWKVTECGADFCRAQGRLARLPANLHMTVKLTGRAIEIVAWLECLADTPVDAVSLRFQCKGAYAKWFLEDQGVALPPIEPGNVDWSMFMRPDSHCRRVLLLDETGRLSPIQAAFETERNYAVVQGFNCDYISGSRMLECMTLIPADESPFPKGMLDIAKMELDLSLELAEAKRVSAQWEERRIFNLGDCVAKLESGYLSLAQGGRKLCQSVNIHTQVCVGGMWIMSQQFLWTQAWVEDGWVHISGTSARVGFTQHWMLRNTPDGLAWRIFLEAESHVEFQDYNVTLGLIDAYTHWVNDHESGAFPDFEAGGIEWAHLNKSYAIGKEISASGAGLPTITLFLNPESPPLRMCALNTGAGQKTRIIQALRSPERESNLSFDAGRHLLFDGVLRAGGGEE